jgi:hypothetical protein
VNVEPLDQVSEMLLVPREAQQPLCSTRSDTRGRSLVAHLTGALAVKLHFAGSRFHPLLFAISSISAICSFAQEEDGNLQPGCDAAVGQSESEG